jgi:hypothetical protein
VTVPDAVRLALRFDADALAADVARLPADAWVPHFNTGIYEGDWSGLSLRSVGGRPATIYPDPAANEPWRDTALLERSPALRSALGTLRCEMHSVRLLRLGPGARVAEHRDYRLGYEDGEIRLHVPITTGPGARFFLNGESLSMGAGECWYVNVNRPHRVGNDDALPRVHLVLDAVVDDWLESEIRSALSGMSATL